MKFYRIGLYFIGLLLVSSCNKDFLDVNNDPNRPTDENITPQQIFPAAAQAVGERSAFDFGFLQNWVGYFASNGDFARNQQETSYDIDFTFGNTAWINHYNTLFDLYLVKTKSLVPNGDTVLAGASMILSAKLFQDLVDVYGEIPYNEAFQAVKNPRPKLDDAKTVYDQLQKSLDTAIIYMQLEPPQTLNFATYDIVNKGDQEKWIRFANTLKLRMLIRQSEVSGFDPSGELAKIKDNGFGFLEAGDDIVENPGYLNDVNKQSPFFATFGYSPTHTKATTSTNANAFIVNTLQSIEDPRYQIFFAPVGSSFIGDVYGDEPGNIPAGAASSYFGDGLLGPNAGTTGTGATQDQWIYPGFESLFLQAEAISRGWISGDANTAFQDAIKASFHWFGNQDKGFVADYDALGEDYIANNPYADLSNAADAGGTEPQLIAFQKYIAMTGVDPLEAWCDIRRLDFLTAIVSTDYISANPGRISNTLPERLLYPQSEYTTNGANVPKQSSGDQFTKKLFWEP